MIINVVQFRVSKNKQQKRSVLYKKKTCPACLVERRGANCIQCVHLISFIRSKNFPKFHTQMTSILLYLKALSLTIMSRNIDPIG